MGLIALLPMKGHSERVANKNIRDFCGKPLFCYVINSLLSSEVVDMIYVDTDDSIIKNLVKSRFECVAIIDRPQELCGDYVSMNEIIKYDISVTKGSDYIQTHATNPLLSPKTIRKAFEKYCYMKENRGADSLFSVNRIQTRLYDDKGNPVNHNPEELIRTQDLKPLFEENSNIYIFSEKSFMKRNSRIGVNPVMFEMDKTESIDIDTEDDFNLAKLVLSGKERII